MTVRAAERAAQNGGARRRPRRASTLDPDLVERARTAATRLTGFPAQVRNGALQVSFGDDTGLAELVEALEVATRD